MEWQRQGWTKFQQIRNHNVYEKVPLEECHQKTGKAPIKVKWVDINKGDEINKEYRSRLVAKEIKRDKREDLFAATPPLEAKEDAVQHGCDRRNWSSNRQP